MRARRDRSAAGLGLGGAATGPAGTGAVICLAIGSVACAAVFSAGAAILAGLASTAGLCVTQRHRYLYVKIPDFGNSHCGD